ncbi:alpha/beta fold hydrolase [Streptococcus downei]|uniref:Hydrolase, alpha/beta hydrolase fold family n=1 Tax=Streptococcus downei MFe28 TaxID=764290 RepID=A0A380JEC3_STRDO|nr:alpha/beta hydrolase [Streptococcus downei]EFQ57424.1 hydrolase, alpha/beta domain protein [Streptococcus downei F0415]SUN36343.1 Hydrolase, alpha/beta hydrolase fold family [Streptococcus downei MFe28]
MVEIQERYLTMRDGQKIFIKVAGQGYPIVFLHGNGNSSKYFAGQLEDFAKKYQVIMVDSRAHGKSGLGQLHLTFEKMAKDLAEVLDQLAIRQAILIGHSDGANYALVFEHLYPERVKAVLLNSGNLTFWGQKWWLRLGSVLTYLWLSLQVRFKPAVNRRKQRFGLMVRNLPIKFEDLRGVTVPSLVLVGQKDFIRQGHSRRIARYLANAKFLSLNGFGHSIANKDPQVFNQLALDFVQQVLGSDE